MLWEVNMKRYLRIYKLYFTNSAMLLLSHRFNFIMSAIANIIWTIGQIVTLRFMFTRIDSFDGWTFGELLLLLGFGQILFYVAFMLFETNLDNLPDKIISGSLDRYLSRPLNIKFQLSFEQILIAQIIPSLTTIVPLISYGIIQTENISLTNFLYAFTIIFIALIDYYFFSSMFSAINFFVDKGQEAKEMFVYGSLDLNRIPLNIFPKIIRYSLTFLVPIAFVSYYPVLIIKNQESFLSVLAMELILFIITFFLSKYAWSEGLKRYSGAG